MDTDDHDHEMVDAAELASPSRARAEARALAAGSNATGQLGIGGAADAVRLKRVAAPVTLALVVAGDAHAAGVSEDGALYTWGAADRGQGGGGRRDEPSDAPVRVAALDGRRVVSAAVGLEHSLVAADGEALAWGSNEFGQCGVGGTGADGSSVCARPRVARGMLRGVRVVAVAAGERHSLALSQACAVYAWGSGDAGQLGLGDFTDRAEPARVDDLSGVSVVALAAGEAHSVALSATGTVYTWGRGKRGQLGLARERVAPADAPGPGPSRGGSAAPELVWQLQEMGFALGLATRACIATGNASAALAVEWALANPGAGGNDAAAAPAESSAVDVRAPGALLGNQATPTRVAGLEGVHAVSAGRSHTAACTEDGAAFTFGSGGSGALGHGGTADESTPRRVQRLPPDAFVRSVACGAEHTLFLVSWGTDGPAAVFACGAGEEGALGMGDARTKLIPVEVPGTEGATAVAAGGHSSFVVINGPHPPSEPTPLQHLQGALDAAHSEKGSQRAMLAASSAVGAVLGDPGALVAAFARRDGKGVAATALETAYTAVLSLYDEGVIQALRSATGSLIEQLQQHGREGRDSPERALALIAAMQNPIIGQPRLSQGLLKKLCDMIVELPALTRAAVVRWWAIVPADILGGRIVRPLQAFITQEIQTSRRVDDTVAHCIMVLGIIEEANRSPLRPRSIALPMEEFYNEFISDHFDVQQDYTLWRGGNAPFTFCDYPFILSSGAKSKLLHVESLIHMQNTVQMSRVENMFGMMSGRGGSGSGGPTVGVVRKRGEREQPGPSRPSPRWLRQLFGQGQAAREAQQPLAPSGTGLERQGSIGHPPPEASGVPAKHPEACILRIRRTHLVEDALDEIARQQLPDLFKPLRVHFIGEEGVDAGGVKKEFFQLLMVELTRPEYGMFCENEESRTQWLSDASLEAEDEWLLVGVIFGLAIYNGVLLDLHLPLAAYKKLLEEPPTLADLEEMRPDVARSMKKLLRWDGPGSVEDVFCQTFAVESQRFGSSITTPLRPGGEGQPVTEENRAEYVELYVDWVFNRSVASQFAAVKRGFLMLCGGPALRLFRPSELETLVVGAAHLDFAALEASARYEGYAKTDPPVVHLWQVVHELGLEDKKRFLRFVTGCDRAPIGGLGKLQVVVQRDGPTGDSFKLPTSHTCFNTLMLPPYGSRGKLRDRLTVAIQNASAGFGLE